MSAWAGDASVGWLARVLWWWRGRRRRGLLRAARTGLSWIFRAGAHCLVADCQLKTTKYDRDPDGNSGGSKPLIETKEPFLVFVVVVLQTFG